MSVHPNPEIPLIVAAAYEGWVEEQLRAGARIAALFPVSEETRQRWMEQERIEQERRVSLMRDHLPVQGTTDVCSCGHVGYSTPGYLLHVYEVVEEDHVTHAGCGDC